MYLYRVTGFLLPKITQGGRVHFFLSAGSLVNAIQPSLYLQKNTLCFTHDLIESNFHMNSTVYCCTEEGGRLKKRMRGKGKAEEVEVNARVGIRSEHSLGFEQHHGYPGSI
ncbi:hypothetical protein RO3G_16305 [Rhizopus delemar RA 99-880]|uniref:Uncharacterized protein n=1 Tax=Rhizopus delemar (strain RA 99-880 / ATCC MYA-4621 / FGSC 9543 / NRRL 43880) TaxID=246409 RepID=I1CT14_RHIO9|nr:hypothetical protein RO3G_16305 [Rhizopus delemar RA 99-880]|eukprot:EIE91594.1 hypothetical protein RO3G_16305 [Rhizopus delemar RA 99-880]